MALQRGIDEGDSGTDSTGIPTTHDSNEEATSAAEAQQLVDNIHQYEYEFWEAEQEEESQQDEGNNGYGTDRDMPLLVAR